MTQSRLWGGGGLAHRHVTSIGTLWNMEYNILGEQQAAKKKERCQEEFKSL